MSDQPYEGPYEDPYQGQQYDGRYEGYAPYQQTPQAPQAPQAGWPGQQQYDEGAAQQQQYTQQWEGQTWETQVHQPVRPTVPAADTAYLPQQGLSQGQGHGQAEASYGTYGAPQQSYGAQGQGQGQYGVVGQPMPGHQAHQAPAGGNAVPEPAPAATPASGYGPATVTGNTRVTDAQRARAEGRSPIIEPGGQPAVLTAILGLLLAGAAAVGQYALVVPLVILQAVTAAGWFRLNGMWPARQGIALAFAGALTADVALLVAGRENAPAAILGTLGVWVLLTLVLQLRSHAGADERMLGLMATVVSAALAIIATGYLAAEPDAVIVGGVAVAAALPARALPLPTAASVVVALLAAVGAGVAVGALTDLGAGGAVLGAGAGVCALVGHRVASYDYPSKFVHFTAGVALPLAAAAPAVYLLGRALI
ncbi:hypothetical protein [Streptomyces tauricus]|uniref:hypothetical protein n=1 Tax=Streptomyces tauricus TaxID=68274 RepID=UPI002243AA2A|nr:hypothetical protein [Streptomyces tauricus]MCW8101544.1 hypothetical protein [Streptomyces tauricus]